MNEPLIPPAVQTIWWIALLVTLVIFVPLCVYLLHRTFVAARSIERYASDALAAAAGIAGNTHHIPALNATISIAGDMLPVAGGIVTKLDTAATVLAQRAV
jgi:hypothetical protein